VRAGPGESWPLHFIIIQCKIAILLCGRVAMSRQKETEHTNDILLFNCLLSSMNHQLISATPEKKEAVYTVVRAIAVEIFKSFSITLSPEYLKFDLHRQVATFKLFDMSPKVGKFLPIVSRPLPCLQLSLEELKENIYKACEQEEIFRLILNDPKTLLPIGANLVEIINQFIAENNHRDLNYFWGRECQILAVKEKSIAHKLWKSKKQEELKILQDQTFEDIKNYPPKYKYYSPQGNSLTPYKRSKDLINPYPSFFSIDKKALYDHHVGHYPNQILQLLPADQIIDFFNRNYGINVDTLESLLRRNLNIVRFLLVLFDGKGNRFLPLTQQNLVAVCRAVSDHQANIDISADQLDRLFYLCSESKRFSVELTCWMRMYEQHSVANEIPITFPELLLTYCTNHSDLFEVQGPLSLQTLCAKVVVNTMRRNLIPDHVPQDIIDKVVDEDVQLNVQGDDPKVLNLLSNLLEEPVKKQALQLGF
jgi:hypothetical protein